MKILYIENYGKVITNAIQSLRDDIVIATTEFQGLSWLKRDKCFDIIILNQVLSNIDLLKFIKEIAKGNQTSPLILVNTYAASHERIHVAARYTHNLTKRGQVAEAWDFIERYCE
jgi:CheY-like chemotaxis protein